MRRRKRERERERKKKKKETIRKEKVFTLIDFQFLISSLRYLILFFSMVRISRFDSR